MLRSVNPDSHTFFSPFLPRWSHLYFLLKVIHQFNEMKPALLSLSLSLYSFTHRYTNGSISSSTPQTKRGWKEKRDVQTEKNSKIEVVTWDEKLQRRMWHYSIHRVKIHIYCYTSTAILLDLARIQKQLKLYQRSEGTLKWTNSKVLTRSERRIKVFEPENFKICFKGTSVKLNV